MSFGSNMSILQRNTLLGLSDEAGSLYLRGCDRDEATAFRMACEWQERIEPVLDRMIAAAESVIGAKDVGVHEFIRERHFRRYFPQGRKS